MRLHWKSLSGCLLVASTLFGFAKIAQAEPYIFNPVSDQFNEKLFKASGDYFQGTEVFRPAADILGIGSPSGIIAFPEREIERDASRIHGFYREMMQRQVSSDAIIRTPDMMNPFDTSVMTMPPRTLPYPALGQ
jgi:hypothetical protein